MPLPVHAGSAGEVEDERPEGEGPEPQGPLEGDEAIQSWEDLDEETNQPGVESWEDLEADVENQVRV